MDDGDGRDGKLHEQEHPPMEGLAQEVRLDPVPEEVLAVPSEGLEYLDTLAKPSGIEIVH